jgi:hypothetical protein
MRRFLIQLVQVFALVIIGTGFLVDSSFAETAQEVRAKVSQACATMGGTFVTERNGNYSCIYSGWTGNVARNCTRAGICSFNECSGGRCTRSPWVDAKTGKPAKPTKRDDGTTTMTAGTTADRGLRTPGATTSGAPVNSGLKAVAPSHTAPVVSTGAALNTQAATGLAGIDKPAAIPSQLSDRLNRMRR